MAAGSSPLALPPSVLFGAWATPVALFSLEGTFVYLNPEAERQFGLESRAVLGTTYLAAGLATADTKFHAAFVSARDSNEPVVDSELPHAAGDQPVHVEIYRAQDHIVVIGQTRAPDRQFRSMVEGMPQLSWCAGADGAIHYYNPRWYEYTGTTFEDMAGWGWQSVHDPEHLPSVVERWTASIVSGAPFEMEFPLRRHDGEFRWFLTRVTPIRSDAGTILRWIGINTDIHEQKRTSEQLEETLESMGDAFLLLDADWCVLLGAVPRNRRVD